MLTQRSAPPNTSIYEQKIEPYGYQYLTTRDGTKLAIDVHPPQDVLKLVTGQIPNPAEGTSGGTTGGGLPEVPQLPLGELEKIIKEIPGVSEVAGGLSEVLGKVGEGLGIKLSGSPRQKLLQLRQATKGGATAGKAAHGSAIELPYIPTGPTPTLIEYAGYGYADPAGPEHGISLIANLMGFTVVDVNMRGTGCSGGAYDFFEPLQNLDGYDVIETIAHQPWVLHHEVGMMGISYGGISQLFTAATRPPSLAAIAPLSVIDNTQTTLYPGGILNTGFALEWAKERVHDAEPAGPTSGQAYA